MNKILSRLFPLLLVGALIGGSAALAADSEKPASRTIVLVRHGNYVADPAADPRLGPGLSPIGVVQANLAGARLAEWPTRFDAMYVSPLQRARDTAAIIGASLPGSHFRVLDDLAECTPPTRRADIMEKEKPEELQACKSQLDRFFSEHFKPAAGTPRQELFVCHGNVIRYLVTRALDVDPMSWLVMSIGHASITTIQVEANGRVRVLSVGDVGHIPPNLQTGSVGDRERSLTIPALP